jgi:hypothetical protein
MLRTTDKTIYIRRIETDANELKQKAMGIVGFLSLDALFHGRTIFAAQIGQITCCLGAESTEFNRYKILGNWKFVCFYRCSVFYDISQ